MPQDDVTIQTAFNQPHTGDAHVFFTPEEGEPATHGIPNGRGDFSNAAILAGITRGEPSVSARRLGHLRFGGPSRDFDTGPSPLTQHSEELSKLSRALNERLPGSLQFNVNAPLENRAYGGIGEVTRLSNGNFLELNVHWNDGWQYGLRVTTAGSPPLNYDLTHFQDRVDFDASGGFDPSGTNSQRFIDSLANDINAINSHQIPSELIWQRHLNLAAPSFDTRF